jgi:hypothetical protein
MISRRPSVRRLRPKASPVRTVGRRWFATYCPADLGVSQSSVGLEDRRICGSTAVGQPARSEDSVKVDRPPRRTPGPQRADEGVTPSSATRAKGRHRSSTVISARCRSRRTEFRMLPTCSSLRQPSRKGYVRLRADVREQLQAPACTAGEHDHERTDPGHGRAVPRRPKPTRSASCSRHRRRCRSLVRTAPFPVREKHPVPLVPQVSARGPVQRAPSE